MNATLGEKVGCCRRPIKPEEESVHDSLNTGVTGMRKRSRHETTLTALKLFTDNWRWRNVPSTCVPARPYDKVTEIIIQFRHSFT
jgi:glucose-6-phosphate 1-dehydrogenase